MPEGKIAAPDPWPPPLVTPVSAEDVERGDGRLICEFIDEYGRITKDSVGGRAGSKLVLRGWQRELTGALFARGENGLLLHSQALIGVPRKNGKSAWLQEVGKAGLFLGPEGGEVYSVAGDRNQARIVFAGAKRSIEMCPELAEQVKLYRDTIEYPATGSIWRVLSSEAGLQEGLNPSLTLFDEVHVQPDDELWNVMSLATGGRTEPLTIGITTAGSRTDRHGADTLCYAKYQYGKRIAAGEIEDRSFFFAWWEPKLGADCDHADPQVWAESNPGLGDLVRLDDFESSVKRTPESEFRTKRTNVFVVAGGSAFPHGVWSLREDTVRAGASERHVLFFDGSWSGDCTGLIGCTLTDPHLFRVGLWENPGDDPSWRVPVNDVKQTILDWCRTHDVAEVACDSFRWQATMADLEDEGLLVVDWTTGSLPRMVPAWKAFYDAVMDGGLTHDGDPALSRHIEAMRLKIDSKGARPVKESAMSGRHIDLGICAVGAFAEACAFDVVDADPMSLVW